ncbi:MAG: Rrf2 family transcriptional regulator [Bacteroidetes bacterium]|nr:Rrf2 family transcriptional regulator [Bacteroidota bacterium]MBS1648218.1 Rrf2 family transcriptional regulator [Bacteroidota bacterium]
MFSKSTEYALRATIFIARNSSADTKVSIQSIAEGIGAPKPFIAKILQQLSNKQNQVISSTPGPSGGFFITKEKRSKPIYIVIEAMGDSTIIENCVLGLPNCSDAAPCSMHKVYKNIRKDLLSMFKDRTIDEIAKSKDRLIPTDFSCKE